MTLIQPVGHLAASMRSARRRRLPVTYSATTLQNLLAEHPREGIEVTFDWYRKNVGDGRVLVVSYADTRRSHSRRGHFIVQTIPGGKIQFHIEWLEGLHKNRPALIPVASVQGGEVLEQYKEVPIGEIIVDALGLEPILLRGQRDLVRHESLSPGSAAESLKKFFSTPNACATREDVATWLHAVLEGLDLPSGSHPE